jgi:hypothetical protein
MVSLLIGFPAAMTVLDAQGLHGGRKTFNPTLIG